MWDIFSKEIDRAVEQLLGRSSGPMYFRLLIQPAVAITLAIRAGLRDTRENKPAFLWELLTNPAQRRQLLQSVWKDLGRIIIASFGIDIVYQLIVFKFFYPLQSVIVTVAIALLPYIMLRGPVTRLSRRFKAPKS
jgi:hypothetical protein